MRKRGLTPIFWAAVRPRAVRRWRRSPGHLGRQLRRDVERLHVLGDLLDARRAGDHGADVAVQQAPRERELRERAADVLRHAVELADEAVLVRVGQAVAQERVGLERAARAGRHAVAVLAGQQARRERAPRRQAEPDVLVQPRVLLLDALAMQQVVLRLLHHGLVQVAPVGDVPRGADLVGAPLARAPVERAAALDHVVHRPHGFLDRRLGIGAVAEHEIHVVELQALERAVDRLPQVLAVQRVALVGERALALREAPVELGRHDVLQARPGELLQHGAHDLLALAARVDLGVVEEVHPGVERRGHQFARGARVDLVAVGDPGAKGQFGNLEAGAAEATVVHVLSRGVEREADEGAKSRPRGPDARPAPQPSAAPVSARASAARSARAASAA